MLISAPTWHLLVASYLPGIGRGTLWQIASDSDFHKTRKEGLSALHPALIEFDRNSTKLDLALNRAQLQVDQAKNLGANIIGYTDTSYPAALRHATNAPALLWYQGNENALRAPAAAVIGTRYPTHAGKVTAKRVTSALVEGGICIVSGLAFGIDAVAHQACIQEGGQTIAVLASGLDSIAPRANAGLAEQILVSGGGLLSEFPIGMPPLPANFVTRDFTQAAISTMVILIQSDRFGGSMHASRAAVKLKRRLVVAAPVKTDIDNGEPKVDGNLAFIRNQVVDDPKMAFPSNVMDYVQILEGRPEYPQLLRDILNVWREMQPKQRVLDDSSPH